MLLYLVRHGEAVSELEDASRPLSKAGETSVRELSLLIAQNFQITPGYIFHSPKTRAAQTASIISGMLPHPPTVQTADGLLPMDDPDIWAQRLARAEMDTMLVGHLPFLPRLASLLLLFDSGKEILDFTPGTMVCLEKTGVWRVKWMISPDTLKKP